MDSLSQRVARRFGNDFLESLVAAGMVRNWRDYSTEYWAAGFLTFDNETQELWRPQEFVNTEFTNYESDFLDGIQPLPITLRAWEIRPAGYLDCAGKTLPIAMAGIYAESAESALALWRSFDIEVTGQYKDFAWRAPAQIAVQPLTGEFRAQNYYAAHPWPGSVFLHAIGPDGKWLFAEFRHDGRAWLR